MINPTTNPQQISIEVETEDLNKSLHHLRDIIHYKEGVSKIPSSLRTKTDDYFSSIEQQFKKLLSTFQVQQATCNTNQDKSTQAALPTSTPFGATTFQQDTASGDFHQTYNFTSPLASHNSMEPEHPSH
ncbi:hypothetical protein AVEN_95081-1 [Araneus ventricosus]|uniref:Uncharacterized protein n=1 Tax=Araneus ventricosus TaxID=182803 RepID=A0A4Y2U8F5_ARAVE|nr:hypothetical protein AVEN_95081-1 [Araneus ventricosus]